MPTIVTTTGALRANLKYALEATSQLDKFAKNSATAVKNGETLNFFENAIKDIKFFGKANVVLQLASAGLSIVGDLAGAKSTESQILAGVREIIGRVEVLHSDMNTHFTQLEKKLNIQTGQLLLGIELNKLRGKLKYLDTIAKNRAAGKGVGTLTGDLLHADPSMFVDIFTQIESCTHGTVSGDSPNILQFIYETTYGDIRAVLPVAESLMHQASLCLVAHIAVEQLQYKNAPATQNAKAPNLDQIGQLYETGMKNIAKAVHTWTAKCVNASLQKKNIKAYVTAHRHALMAISVDDYQGSAERVALKLQAHYPYLNFSVIAYEAIVGYRAHAVVGLNCDLYKKITDVSNKPMNLFVYWAKRTATNRQPLIAYKEAANPSIFRARDRKDRTFDTQWFNKPIGERYVFIFEIGKKAAKKLSNDIFHGSWGHYNKDLRPFLREFNNEKDPKKREPLSAMWIGFSADYDDNPRDDFGIASYNAMYGTLDVYTTICFFPD